MPFSFSVDDAITAFPDAYVADGAHIASIPVQVTMKLVGTTANNIQKITLVPTGGTAATLPNTFAINEAGAVNSVAATATLARPLGGTGYCGVFFLRAFQLVVTGNEVTNAEVVSGSVASRVTKGTVEILDSSNDVVGTMPFLVLSPGQRSIVAIALPRYPDYDVNSVRLNFTAFALATKVEILTAGDSPD